MKTDDINSGALKVRLILIAGFFILLVFIFSLKSYPVFVEQYYSQGIYPFLRKGILFLFNYVPFSAGDVIYILIILAMILGLFQIISLLIRRKPKIAGYTLLGFILKIEIAISAFYLLWAINYFRQPASARLDLPEYQYNQSELIKATSMLIDSVNLTRSALDPADFEVSVKELYEPSIIAINNLAYYNPSLVPISPKPKASMLSGILNYVGTAGYFNPFTGEAQINSQMPVYTQPFIACHEMAHQMGFGAEDEANFAGFIAAKSSPNKLLKYSAYYLASQEFMVEIWRTDSVEFKRLKEKISPKVLTDFKTEKAYWAKYRGETSRLSSIFYDNYLKANNQPGGLKTYNRMIKLSMAYYKKEGLFN